MSFLLGWGGGQARGGDRLSMALFFFVRNMKTNSLRDFRKFFAKNVFGDIENAVSAFAGHDAAEHEQIAHVVKIGVRRNVIPEVNSDCFVDVHGSHVSPLLELPDVLELHPK